MLILQVWTRVFATASSLFMSGVNVLTWFCVVKNILRYRHFGVHWLSVMIIYVNKILLCFASRVIHFLSAATIYIVPSWMTKHCITFQCLVVVFIYFILMLKLKRPYIPTTRTVITAACSSQRLQVGKCCPEMTLGSSPLLWPQHSSIGCIR